MTELHTITPPDTGHETKSAGKSRRSATPNSEGASSLDQLYAQAILIRAVEERLLQLFSQGKLFGTVHTCIGQEWTGVAVGAQLRDQDWVVSNHRCHGHFIARTDDVDGLLAEVMGKETGVCGGRGGSQHLYAHGFLSNGVQGGILPVAAGLAMSQKLAGQGGLTVVFMGDGTLGEGAVYETLNIASKWNLPLLVVLENNQYSQSTRQAETLAGDICARAAAFGIATRHSNTEHPAQLLNEVEAAIASIRQDQRPVFLRVDTYRLMAHSKGDDDRNPQEIAEYRARDPLTKYTETQPEAAARALQAATARIDAAVAAAEEAAFPAVATPGWSISTGATPVTWSRGKIAQPERNVTLIRNALHRALESDPRVVLLGEDIESPYGGAFKATRGLSETFPGRVRNMPISESLIVGLGNGLALGGWKPVCEIMFGDFLTLCADQLINHASKFRYMYNDQTQVPLIVRTPMGGRRGYGPTHSQSIEKHFLGLPDVRVLAVHHRHDAGDIYDRLFARNGQPTLVIENKVLYGQRITDELPVGFYLEHSDENFPTTRLRPDAPADVTIVCYGEMLREVEDAIVKLFDEHEIVCEVICPAQLYPLNLDPILDSLGGSRRVLVVEEGVGFAGFGAEVISQLAERAAGTLLRARRLACPEQPIPACAQMEKEMLPKSDSIVRTIVEMVSHA
ncbi:MAG: pyruvate dehydrogenase [Planctomycetes bacterium]|nr:pyruvate dehydrogenase [Planctomycetota bacterium]